MDAVASALRRTLSPVFTDAHGWDAPQFYETIQLADVNGDGLADLVGRAVAGIYVQLAHGGGHFAPPTLATSALSDLAGWANPAYYRTIRFADVNGDGRADLVARSSRGVLVGLSTGTTFTSPVLVAPAFSDSAGWMTYGASLRVADIDGDGMADLVARGAAGVYVARALGGGAFGPATLVSTLFADASGWGLPAYSTSLRVADVDGDGIMDLVARGSMGVRVHFGLRAGVFGAASRVTTAFSDARGWGDSAYRASFDAIDVDGDGRAELVARSSNGLLVVSP